jgi:hypothetical protein
MTPENVTYPDGTLVRTYFEMTIDHRADFVIAAIGNFNK